MEDFNVWTAISAVLAALATFFGAFWSKIKGWLKTVRTVIIPQIKDLVEESVDVVQASAVLADEAEDVVKLVLKSIEDNTLAQNKDQIKLEALQVKDAAETLKKEAKELKAEFDETLELFF